MDIFFPHTIRERAEFKESAVKCGFVELIAETTANVGILPADERISTLLVAWKNIGNYLTKNPYNHDVGITVSWVGRCTLNLWFGREWIACAIENKTELIEQMMKVYPTAFITLHPYSWPYMFSIYRDPWMVEYLNLNFQRMSGPDLTPVLASKDSEFIQQEGIPLLILRMVNMFDFRMVKLVKYMCLRLLLTWQDTNSTASKTLRASPNANQYIDYARHIYLLAICESNGFKDLHYTLETIQRVIHCDLKETLPLELGAQTIARGLQETNTTLTELLITFLFKVPKIQFGNMFGSALTKYVHFITEYQLRNINRLSSVKLSLPIQEVYSKLVEMFITHRESSEDLIKATSKLSEQIFRELHNLTASKCAYELIKQRHHAEWYTSKITLLLTIISEEINIIQDYKYNDVQSTDELIEKEKEVAIYYRDLAKLFHKSPYLEQEAWLTTFSLHPCREFMDAVIRCGARNLRAIKRQAHKLKVIEVPESKTKTIENTAILIKEDIEKNSQKEIDQDVAVSTVDTIIPNNGRGLGETSQIVATNSLPDSIQAEFKRRAKRPPRKKSDKNGPKKIEPKVKEETKNTTIYMLASEDETKDDKTPCPFKRGRPVGALGKDTKNKSRPTNSQKTHPKKSGERPDLAEEIFAAAAGAADNINGQTIETIKYPAFALMNSVTDTEELMKFTNYDEAYEQYTELNRILSHIKLNQTCYEDLLTLLIAPRYKRLTWAVSWKKLKKRCRVILTKDNKKRELVEQSMADANDRLTHLNIDYDKYKDKPQIDYGTIEDGYECYGTDSDDDDLNKTDMQIKKTNERQSTKKKVGKLVGSFNKDITIRRATQNANIDTKPYLKIENLDSSTSNLLNIFESTHLSKPVYLNKPVYFVRNPLASPSSETAISLETGLENHQCSRTSSRRSTGEETLTSDSFEEHHWHLTTTESSSDLKDQQNNISQLSSSSSLCKSFLKSETTFNIPASIKQQLEQPTMFFKSELKNDLNVVSSISKQEELKFFSSNINDLSETVHHLPCKVGKINNHTSTLNQINPILTATTSLSPKLFEDMPEDLTMPKSSKTDSYETDTSLSNFPLNLTNRMVTEPVSKTVSFQEQTLQNVDEFVEGHIKKGKIRPLRSLTKTNSRKSQTKDDRQHHKNEELKDFKTQLSITQPQHSINQAGLIPETITSLKSVRIFPHNKNSKAIRINPTAAVVFSSAAASYHRTPFLNVAQQEPNILQQLLSKEIEPFSGIDKFIDKTTEAVSNIKDEKMSAIITPKELIKVSDPINTVASSSLEVRSSNTQSLLPAVTLNPKDNINTSVPAELNKKEISSNCDNEIRIPYAYYIETDQKLQNACSTLQNITIVEDNAKTEDSLEDNETSELTTIIENIAADESPTTVIDDCLKTTCGALAAYDKMQITSHSPDFEFEFKVPAVVPKPCFFMRSKSKQVYSYASDWVKNITFNDKTAEIIVPVSRIKKVTESYDLPSNIIEDPDEQCNKISCSNVLIPLPSQNQSDDVLYNKHIVFNTKLLDPHLKTYKNTKAFSKITDAKKFKQTFSETDEFFSENPEELNAFDKNNLEPAVSNGLKKVSSDSSFEKPAHSPVTISESHVQHCRVKSNKKRTPPIPSTKKFDKMFDWIDTVTTANRNPIPESIGKSETLLNLFSAQLMNQAKSIHFNFEYLREKELLKDRADEEGINCEASILIASPGPSEDCVKLIKAFKKNTVFKGVDLSSNEISFTSSLAKEVLGTIVKVTLNESKNHTSCSGDHFDASDALDEFIRFRRHANSPTFYSPTLSMKHLKNDTLADSVEYIDTSLEKFIPKPGRKRSTVSAPLPVKKRIRKQKSIDNSISIECKHQSAEEILSPLNEIKPIAETTVVEILKTEEESILSNCSTMKTLENVSVESAEASKPLAQSHLGQLPFDQFPVKIDSMFENNVKEKFLDEDILQPVKNEDMHQKAHEKLDYILETIDGSDEQFNLKVKKSTTEKKTDIKKIQIKKIQIENNSSPYHRTRRNTYDGAKHIVKEEMMVNLSPKGKKTQLLEKNKFDNIERKTTKSSIGGYASDGTKHLAETDALKIKENQLGKNLKEVEHSHIADEKNKISISSLQTVHLLDQQKLIIEENIPLDNSEQHLPGEINKSKDSKEKSNQNMVEEPKNVQIKIEEVEYASLKISSEEVNHQPVVKKRIVKPRISYAELDSDSDEPPKSRLKIPSLKINFPLARPSRRKLLNRAVTKKTILKKCLSEKPKIVKKMPNEIQKSFVRPKTDPGSSLNDSDDDKPLSSNINKSENDKMKGSSRPFDDSDAGYRATPSAHILNESDDDTPLKRIPKRVSSRKKLPTLLPPIKKKGTSKLPVRKRYRSAYSPKRPSVRIQSKFSRRRTTSLNYFALFLSDSDEEDLVKPKRRGRTPDRLWTNRSVRRKAAIESVIKKTPHQRKLRCSGVAIKKQQSRNRLTKPKVPEIKMPVLTREDSDHTVEENIYECATMSTANETDEEACSDHRSKRGRKKVVKPMRIRCVSRRTIPTDIITESSSCSSSATVQTARDLRRNSTSIGSFTKRDRLLRRKTLEKNLLMSNLICESSSSSSPVMMNRRRRQFAAKSTSKPQVVKEHQHKQTSFKKCPTNAKSIEPLSFMEKEAINIHNCVNFQIRLQRLTANEAILCRKPFVRLDRSFVRNYFLEKNMKYNEELKSGELSDDYN